MGLWLHCGLVAAFFGVLASQYWGLNGIGAVGGCIGFLDGGQEYGEWGGKDENDQEGL